tara:strand:+ start:16602 stop:16805 length:204 start_codon:yes stop_codon:yes gene_type:complete
MGESELSGSDVVTEAISDNRRIQAGMKMSNGTINFDERRGEETPKAQNAIDELDNRLVKTHGDRYNV